MPIVSHKLGPGQLELGAVPLEVNAQLTGCKIVPAESVESGDVIKVLSGEELAAEDDVTYTYSLQGTLLQDLAAAGVVDWSWVNKGTWQPFRFVPNDAAAREVSGEVRPVPLQIGGDEVDARMTSEFTWVARGSSTDPDPDFGAV